ncbi:MAG TPA: PDGLE domain-containing protein [Thermomicrobiales bacterium]|nr:PDGLE domain-containing protein [Thermomicrobiales bacterium]
MRKRAGWAALVAAGVGLALLITLFSPFASSSPDGLNKVAQDKGFHQAEKGPSYEIIPGYSLPGIDNPHLAKILSGIIGVLIVTAIGLAAGYGMRRAARSRAAEQPLSNASGTTPSGGAGRT